MQKYLDFTILGNTLQEYGYFLLVLLATLFLVRPLLDLSMNFLQKIAHKSTNVLDDKIIQNIKSPLRLLLLTWLIYSSFHLLQLSENVFSFIQHLSRSSILFSIFWAFHANISLLQNSFMHFGQKFGKNINNEVGNFITKGIKIFVVLLGIMAIFQEWGYNVSGFVASLGLGGLAFALAAKDTASNLFGSLVILGDKPFVVGDWIKTPNVEGTIEDIGIRSTKVRTFAQALVTVPNAVLANSAIINWSRMGKRRIKTSIGVTYDTTPKQMQKILADLKEYLTQHKAIHPDTIFINFSGFGASSLDIFCYFFTNTTQWGDFMNVREEVFLHFMQIIEKNNASIAFPTQTIELHTSESMS